MGKMLQHFVSNMLLHTLVSYEIIGFYYINKKKIIMLLPVNTLLAATKSLFSNKTNIRTRSLDSGGVS